MTLALALADLKDILLNEETDDINLQIEVLAEDYGLKPLFLKNRAIADMGDLSTWADRQRASHEANRANLERVHQKLILSRLEERLRQDDISVDTREEVMEAANELRARLNLGGRWELVRRTQRRPRRESFEQLARRICRDFGIDPSTIRGL